MSELITLYKAGEEPRRVWMVDATPFYAHGWTDTPPAPTAVVASPPAIAPVVAPPTSTVPTVAPSLAIAPAAPPAPAVEPSPAIAQPVPPELKSPGATYQERRTELDGIFKTQGWKPIAEIAGNYKILKPSGGWAEAIPLILKAEGLKP